MSSMSMSAKVLRQPRVSKKIGEVKEVVQNRSDQDIAKVLEHFEYDVAKSIDAFLSDGGKSALSKWSEARSQLNSSQSSLASEPAKRAAKKSSRPNLTDLVASVIDQYTASSASGTPAASASPAEPRKPEQLLDTISRLNTDAPLNGYKVTILGVDTPSQTGSHSSSTSPSSMSAASSGSFERVHQPESANVLFNKSYTNPNAKQLLEKPCKDLHRQSVQLAKVESSVRQQVEEAGELLSRTFEQLMSLLVERRAQLEGELRASGERAVGLVQQRQSKAASLRLLADKGQHLSDAQCNELRADIKHFVSERLLDEQLAKINFFSSEPSEMERIVREIGSFGSVAQVNSQYAGERPADLQHVLSPVQNLSLHTEAKPQRANRKSLNGHGVKVNGAGSHDQTEGAFIEVKKPQRNRNRQNGAQGNGQVNGAQRLVNGERNERK